MKLLSQIPLLLLLSATTALAAPAMPHATAPQINADDADDGDIIIPPAPAKPYVHHVPPPPVSNDDDTPHPTISIAPIPKASTEGYGILEESNGGFPATIWSTSTRGADEALLSQFNSGVANDTVLNLLDKLLMTQAPPPPGASTQDWFLLRVQALMNLGQDDKADQMIASLPVAMTTSDLRQIHSEILLLRGDTDLACKHAASNPGGETARPVYWQKLTIICQARAGKHSEAMLGMDVLREENQLNEPFFQEEIQKFSDKNAVIKSLPKQWSIMDVALARMTGDSLLFRDHLDNVPPVALKYIAQDNSLDIKLREKAGGKAQLMGIVPVKAENITPEQPFEKTLASDVVTLVTALGSGKPANEGDNAIIARLHVGEDSGIVDGRRVQRLLTLMEPFGYKVPVEIWNKLFIHKIRYDGEVPPAIYVSQINEAATAGRKADVILLAALIVDGSESYKITELALLPVIKAMIKVGLEKDARALAYSAVKAYK